MFLHVPEGCLIAPLAALCGVLTHALKTVSQVRSGQTGNIARGDISDTACCASAPFILISFLSVPTTMTSDSCLARKDKDSRE
jgi:hypothetical protein